ncbi:MAG: type II secretion system GspH family protein [Patescibacteria group bacterium]|nr:type II secretion system GspH family protein [Patescibacteria group bacterium]
MKNKKGFTLLELLIVIAILAVLGAIVIFLLNPTETLKKARDSQRISDLSTIKTALGIYLTSTSSPKLDGGTNTLCIGGSGQDTIWYSAPNDTQAITDTIVGGSASSSQSTTANGGLVDGNGWIKVNLSSLISGSPISSFPIDPINTVTIAAVTSTDLVYRYSCDDSPLGFEINAQLESNAFTVEDDKRAKDGGNNANLYEVGSSLTILPTLSDF